MDTFYEPKELRELRAAIADLYFAGAPGLPGGVKLRASPSAEGAATPDAARKRYRDRLKKHLKDIAKMAGDVRADARAEPRPNRMPRWRCSECNAIRRFIDAFCWRCGSPRPEVDEERSA